MSKNGKLLYHLTALENLESILQHGLQPRSQLRIGSFGDVADGEILNSRANHQLDRYVPFHFFARNPFDYGVQRAHPEKDFVLLSVQRAIARANGWRIVPTHPLAGEGYQILDYDTGFNAINWGLIAERNYDDRACKVACMAECLSPTPVYKPFYFAIYVKNARVRAIVDRLAIAHGVSCHINVNTQMFVGE